MHIVLDPSSTFTEATISRSSSPGGHAVAVKKGDDVVAHVPWENERICSFFLQQGCILRAEVTGERVNRKIGHGLEVDITTN